MAGLTAGLTEITGAEGGEFNCVNPGISAVSLLNDRPPVLPTEVAALLALAAASGVVPVDTVPVVMDAVAVAEDGTTRMVARGTMEERLPVFVVEAIWEEVVVSG